LVPTATYGPSIRTYRKKTLNNPQDFDKFGLDFNFKPTVSSNPDERTVTVELILPEDDFETLDGQELLKRIDKLRRLIVDIQVRKTGKYLRDFKVERRFSTELLKTPVHLDPKSFKGLSLSVKHTFWLENDYEEDTYLVIQSIGDAFQKSDITFNNIKVTK